MGRTLKLAQRVFSLGHSYIDQGRYDEALHLLSRLARFGRLPSDIAEDVHDLVGNLYLRRREYARARRQMQLALARHPHSSRLHHLLARAHHEDSDGDDCRAEHHYRLALKLNPSKAVYHSDFGRFLIESGDRTGGLRHLQRAIELEPEESAYVEELAFNLMEAGRTADARRVVILAMFRNPDDGALRRLWNDLRAMEMSARRSRAEKPAASAEGPHLLRYEPAAKSDDSQSPSILLGEQVDGQVIRLDPPGTISPRIGKTNKRRQNR